MNSVDNRPPGSVIEAGTSVRRVVTGLDEDGRSCILFDGRIGPADLSPEGSAINLWRSDRLPADNRGSEDRGSCDFELSQLVAPGSAFILVHYPPGFGGQGAWMHVTDTIDYLIVLLGAVTLVLETEDVTLRAGDVFVDRGVVHGWRNDTASLAMAVVVTVPADKLVPSPTDGVETTSSARPSPDTASWPSVRRVVTGLDRDGCSAVIFDGAVPSPHASTGTTVWHTPTIPADNRGTLDRGSSDYTAEQLTSGGSTFMLVQHSPGFGRDDPHMHAVDALSMMVMLQGEATLVLDTGESLFRMGDVLIERGVNHGWRNLSADPTLAAVVILPAIPRANA